MNILNKTLNRHFLLLCLLNIKKQANCIIYVMDSKMSDLKCCMLSTAADSDVFQPWSCSAYSSVSCSTTKKGGASEENE